MSMTVSQARATLTSALDRVEAGEQVAITRHGKTVAVVVRPDVLRSRPRTPVHESADAITDLLARGRATPERDRPALTPEQAESLVAEVRAGRAR